MTIDEAIRDNEDTVYHAHTNLNVGQERAILLGNEALKGIQAVRQLHPELSPFPLPGETKD